MHRFIQSLQQILLLSIGKKVLLPPFSSKHVGSFGSVVLFFHVGLEEHRWRSKAWQVSHTLTGLGDAGRGSSLSEQLLQKISPQFLQWCCGQSESYIL